MRASVDLDKTRDFWISKVVKKLIFGIGMISVGVIATCLYYTESYFPLYPEIDTVLPPNFTRNFHTITPGMSVDDVESLIGQPIHVYQQDVSVALREDLKQVFQQSPGVVKSCWQYGSDGASPEWDFAWLSYNVCFVSADQVIETGVAIYHD